MNRYESVRLQYRKNRYLEYLSQAELDVRIRDIGVNHFTVKSDGVFRYDGFEPELIKVMGRYWIFLLVDISEELEIRYGAFPSGFNEDLFFKGERYIQDLHSKYLKADLAIAGSAGVDDFEIFKYGKSKWLNDMFTDGVMRLTPTSRYDDDSLNSAVRDDERCFEFKRNPKSSLITTEGGGIIEPIGNVSVQIEDPSDYYLFCFSESYTYREYEDFEADTCIAIRNFKEFFSRVFAALNKQFPELIFMGSPVKYLDPVKDFNSDIDTMFLKHFRYSYQKEYRLICFSDVPTIKLEPIYLNIGSIADIADIFYI